MGTVSELEPKKRRGRPPKAKKHKKSEHVALYATPEQALALERLRKIEAPELSLSEWALKKLLG